MDKDGNEVKGARCGTPHPSRPLPEDQMIQEMIAEGQVEGTGGAISTFFHVMCNDDGSNCAATEQMIGEQVNVLNLAFAPTFSFVHKDTKYTNNSVWNSDGLNYEEEMKSTLSVDPATTLNVYVVESIPNNVLGYAFLPNQYPEDNSMHGIVMRGGTFPGGANAPYNLGDTLVHEAGHYLGMSCQ